MEKKFVRILSALLLSTVLAIGLVACGGNIKFESNTESESKVSETETVSTEETSEADNKDTDNAESIADTEDPTDIAGKTVYYKGLDTAGFPGAEGPFSVYCPEGFSSSSGEPEVFSETDISNAPNRAYWVYKFNDTYNYLGVRFYCEADLAQYSVPEGGETITVGDKTCSVIVVKTNESDEGYSGYGIYVTIGTKIYEITADLHRDGYLYLPYDGDVIKEIISSITPL